MINFITGVLEIKSRFSCSWGRNFPGLAVRLTLEAFMFWWLNNLIYFWNFKYIQSYSYTHMRTQALTHKAYSYVDTCMWVLTLKAYLYFIKSKCYTNWVLFIFIFYICYLSIYLPFIYASTNIVYNSPTNLSVIYLSLYHLTIKLIYHLSLPTIPVSLSDICLSVVSLES